MRVKAKKDCYLDAHYHEADSEFEWNHDRTLPPYLESLEPEPVPAPEPEPEPEPEPDVQPEAAPEGEAEVTAPEETTGKKGK